MKVRLTVTVEVDTEGWSDRYGTEATSAEVVSYVRDVLDDTDELKVVPDEPVGDLTIAQAQAFATQRRIAASDRALSLTVWPANKA